MGVCVDHQRKRGTSHYVLHKTNVGGPTRSRSLTYLVPDPLLGENDVLLRVGDEHDGKPALLLVFCIGRDEGS